MKKISSKGFIYKTEKDIDSNQLVGLFNSVNWKISNFPTKLSQAIKNSDYVYSVWEDVHLVGLLAASKNEDDGFSVNLIIEPNYQNLGLGKKLITDFLKSSSGVIIKLLTTETDLKGYFAKFKFICGGTAMYEQEDWKWGTGT